MIGWCASGRVNRSDRIVHQSAVCDQFRHGNPTRVEVKGDWMWAAPFRMHLPGLPFQWCRVCAKIPPLGSWRDRAACLGSSDDWIMPGRHADRLKAMCRACSVREECAGYAELVNPEFGVWAGRRRDNG